MEAAMFSEGDLLNKQELRKGELRNTTSDIEIKLRELGWDGKMAGCISLELSPDNEKVINGCLHIRGSVSDKELRIDAAKVWAGANPDIFLVIKIPNGEIFNFGREGLTSDYTSQQIVHHTFYRQLEGRNPVLILPEEFRELNIRDFCLRIVVSISKHSSARSGVLLKYTLLLFPETKQKLLEVFSSASNPAWPGMRLAEGEFPMWPRPLTAWKCPVMPLILPGTVFRERENVPTDGALRAAISAIMEKSAVAETGRTGAAVAAKWRKLENNPAELILNRGAVRWPTVTPEPPPQGK